MKVFLVRESGGMPVRLGTVASMTTLRIPMRGPVASELNSQGSLRFLISPLGNPRKSYTTHSVIMAPGDLMSLTVANQSWLTTLVVRSE